MQEERSHDGHVEDLRQHSFSSLSGKIKGKGIIREPLSIETSERAKCKSVIIIDLEEKSNNVEGHTEENSEQERFTTETTDEPEGLGRKKTPEQESDLMQPQYLELQIIEGLRGKAMRLKKRLLRRFKTKQMFSENQKRKTKKQVNEQGLSTKQPENYEECSYPHCTYGTSRRSHILSHIATHYPDAYFCPVCYSTFSRLDTFDRHFERAATGRDLSRSRRRKDNQNKRRRKDFTELREFRYDVPCVESEKALRYEVGRDKERFNFYYLGVMEDYDMSEEHFEILAGRRRGDTNW